MALTRLSDRIDQDPDGGEVIVKRWGLWGTTSEIEKRDRKYYVVHPNHKEKEFKHLEEAEKYLERCVGE